MNDRGWFVNIARRRAHYFIGLRSLCGIFYNYMVWARLDRDPVTAAKAAGNPSVDVACDHCLAYLAGMKDRGRS